MNIKHILQLYQLELSLNCSRQAIDQSRVSKEPHGTSQTRLNSIGTELSESKPPMNWHQVMDSNPIAGRNRVEKEIEASKRGGLEQSTLLEKSQQHQTARSMRKNAKIACYWLDLGISKRGL